MAARRLLGCLAVAALVVCTGAACKDKDKDKGAAAKKAAPAGDVEGRCSLLGKACGDKEKHVEKIVEECKQAAKKHAEKGCPDKASAVYECYLRDVCGGAEKVWTLDDLGVLADRHKKCAAERAASRACVEGTGGAKEGSAR